jgi:hypothetical protein
MQPGRSDWPPSQYFGLVVCYVIRSAVLSGAGWANISTRPKWFRLSSHRLRLRPRIPDVLAAPETPGKRRWFCSRCGSQLVSTRDANDDGKVQLGDAVFLLTVLLYGGSLPAPFPVMGLDPTPDSLGCHQYPALLAHEKKAALKVSQVDLRRR